ncbi:peptide/nickel transport system substrate-binding protein [Sporobacter termitidis DSM 10068]|uniref:Peptide/nickel transport system substrate-binding protein n=1 Tax=Sporobacter termitidis DSM 10068 TaxID=1123282 RepID=A0A1M5XAU6_9FIRM|nr:ABC transporter substrate-binding protein [Sporobacter termitidis]SHH96950.1 peptide/nickel transport system substrate-binding protein [Sporobacter termitidis DSM 10068]
MKTRKERNMKNFKRIIAVALVGILSLSAGCAATQKEAAPENSVPPVTESASPSAAQSTPASDVTVRVALGSEPDNLDPMLSAATDTAAVMMNVYEGLMGFDQKGDFIPAIAQSYTAAPDGLSYTFTLKKGVKFHDGKDCTAKDVKYTYEKLAGLTGEKPLNSTLSQELVKVETPDDYTVVLTLKQRDAGFMSKTILSIEEEGYADNSTKPIGTGPYKFVEYIQGQKIVLEKNENYSTIAERKPTIGKVEFVIMTDENAKLMALKSGNLDIAGVSAPNAAALGDDFSIVQGPQNMVQVLALNNAVKPLDNLKVRQAINYAVNKDEIIGAVVDGKGTKVESFLSPSMATYYNDNIAAYKTDIEKAKSLLKEAGYEKGFDLTITVPSNYQTHIDTAQVIKDQLAQVGINVNIQLIEWAQWLDGVYTKRDYQSTIIGHSGKLDPQDFLNRFTSTYDKNYFNFTNPDYDKLVTEAAATTDISQRAALYKQCQQFLVDQAASVFIQDPHIIFAVSKKLDGLQIYPVTFFNMSDIHVKS